MFIKLFHKQIRIQSAVFVTAVWILSLYCPSRNLFKHTHMVTEALQSKTTFTSVLQQSLHRYEISENWIIELWKLKGPLLLILIKTLSPHLPNTAN